MTTYSPTGGIPEPPKPHNSTPKSSAPNSSGLPTAQSEKPYLETEPGKSLSGIQKYLHQGVNEALQTSEALTKHVEKQAKFIKVLALLFATFSAYLQVRQIYLGNASSQQESKFSAWEMVQNVQGKDVTTSAGLAIALKTLASNCEPLSGIDLTGKYLPSLELAPPTPTGTEHILSLVGRHFFAVTSQHECGMAKSAASMSVVANAKTEPVRLDLRGIRFEQAQLQTARFTDTDLSGASFQEANLKSVAFEGTAPKLEKVNFQRALLSQANLSGANLSGANFTGANLSEVNLKGTNLSGAILNQTILLGADLRASDGLTQLQLEGAAQPLLCNSALPSRFAIDGGLNRDCDAIAAVLHERYSEEFPTIDAAEVHVGEQRQKTFESRRHREKPAI